MPPYLDEATAILAATIAVVVARTLPIAAHALLLRSVSLGRSLLVTGMAIAILSLDEAGGRSVLRWGFHLGYAACVAAMVVGLRIERRSRTHPLGALFSLPVFFVALVLVPAVAHGEDAAARAVAVVGGTEMTLSCASYWGSREAPAGWKAGLFFILADPSLAVHRRARGLRGLSVVEGLRRFFGGALLTALAITLAVMGRRGDASLILMPLGFYLGHAGVAELQAGALWLDGFEVEPRYLSPWRAADPGDAWRRWNTYLGAWLRAHVFVPVHRATGSGPVALGASFGVSGLLHAAAASIIGGRLTGSLIFLAFLGHGLLVGLWPRQGWGGGDGVGSRLLCLAVMSPAAVLTIWALGS